MSKRGENIYLRKDGRWEGRVRIQSPTRKLVSVYGKSYREVKQKMKEEIPHNRAGNGHVKVSDAVSAWLTAKSRFLKPSSVAKYRNLARRHILPHLGECRIGEMNADTVRAFAQRLSGTCEGGAQLCRSTMRDVLMILEGAVRFSGGQTPVIDKRILLGKTDRKLRCPVLSESEQHRLEQHLLTDTNERKLGLLICLYAGLRIGEICAMRWECIDLQEKTLRVLSTMQRLQVPDAADGRRTAVVESAPKSHDSKRVIPIADFLIAHLCEKKPSSPSAYLLTGTEQYLEPRSLEYFYKRTLAASGIPKHNFHTLRHTFATRCIESGVDVKTVSELLGHSTVKLTLDRYVHPTMDFKRTGINQMVMSRQNSWSED